MRQFHHPLHGSITFTEKYFPREPIDTSNNTRFTSIFVSYNGVRYYRDEIQLALKVKNELRTYRLGVDVDTFVIGYYLQRWTKDREGDDWKEAMKKILRDHAFIPSESKNWIHNAFIDGRFKFSTEKDNLVKALNTAAAQGLFGSRVVELEQVGFGNENAQG